jgi:hemerythrin-like domain-containing protein
MMPIAPLMIEHRLIERVIAMMKQTLREAEQEQRVDPRFIDHATRFIREYADRCHHGKEEDILFRELGKKPMTEEHQRIMGELVQEHKWGRKTTRSLTDANRRYEQGEAGALYEITDHIRSLVGFYPEHIEKEDKGFFLPVMDYFSDEEKDRMLWEGRAFDSDLLHREWDELVSSLEGHPETAEKASTRD